MIKLVVADIDGTLVDDNKNISPDFYDVLDVMNERGILFAIASGRSYNSIIEAFPKAREGIIISENGAYIRYRDEELFTLPLDRAEANLIIKEAELIPGAVIMYSVKEMQYVKNADKDVLEIISTYVPKYELVESFDEIVEPPIELTFFDQNGAQDNCYKYLSGLDFPNSKAAISGYTWLDVMNKDADKGNGVKIVMSRFGISYEEVAAIGDNYNDIEMLESVYHSYAMKNSPEDIKRIARYVTEKDNNEFGAVFEMKKILDML